MPSDFDLSMIRPAAAEALRAALAGGNFPSACLFSGGDSALRYACGLWLAKTLLCRSAGPDGPCGKCPDCLKVDALSHPDLSVISGGAAPKAVPPAGGKKKKAGAEDEDNTQDGSSQDGETTGKKKEGSSGKIRRETIDNEIFDKAELLPHEAARRVFLVNDADLMGEDGQNRLLKITEEAPDNVFFIFTTFDSDSLLDTIRSRFTLFRIGDTGVPRLLSDDEAGAKKLCRALAQAAASRSEYAMMLACAPLAGRSMTRQQAHDVLLLFTLTLTQALKLAYGAAAGQDADPDCARRLASAYSPAQLISLTRSCTALTDSIVSRNVNLKLAAALLSSETGRIVNGSNTRAAARRH